MKSALSISRIVAAMALLAFSTPVFAAKNDNRIETAAKQSYVFKTYLKNDDIKIKSSGGVVTLTGSVNEESHKILARDTVADLPGVKSVDDKLTVKVVTSEKNADEWLAIKVKTTLLFHSSVKADKTEVLVSDGNVILRGEAASQAQKELTTEYARDVDGVKDVSNEMTVKITPNNKRTVGTKIDDSSITAQVKMTLLYHRSTSAINTTVSTRRAVVTVSGIAENQAEKDLVTKLVSDIRGVTHVTNLMKIK